jgi:hypothetical protein
VIKGWVWKDHAEEPHYLMASAAIGSRRESFWSLPEASYTLSVPESHIIPLYYPRAPAPWPLTVARTWEQVDGVIREIRDIGRKFKNVKVNMAGMVWFVPGGELAEEFPDDLEYASAIMESNRQII